MSESPKKPEPNNPSELTLAQLIKKLGLWENSGDNNQAPSGPSGIPEMPGFNFTNCTINNPTFTRIEGDSTVIFGAGTSEFQAPNQFPSASRPTGTWPTPNHWMNVEAGLKSGPRFNYINGNLTHILNAGPLDIHPTSESEHQPPPPHNDTPSDKEASMLPSKSQIPIPTETKPSGVAAGDTTSPSDVAQHGDGEGCERSVESTLGDSKPEILLVGDEESEIRRDEKDLKTKKRAISLGDSEWEIVES